jgi:UDP-N-acetylglucosamine 2-epimerase (non-hydrolysing)
VRSSPGSALRPAGRDGPGDQQVQYNSDPSVDLPVLFPLHPRTREALDARDLGPRLRLLDPLSYPQFLSLEADAAAVLTDSGGIQEETTFLGVPCFTLRDNTERPITLRCGTNTLLGLDPARIADILPPLERRRDPVAGLPPLWDGQAAERIADEIERAVISKTLPFPR